MAAGARGYRQPRRLNVVSISLVLFLAVAGYAAFATWPVISLNADVRSALDDVLPKIYRANLLPESESAVAADEARRLLVDKLTTLGVANPDAALTITRDTKVVAISIKVDTAVDLKVIGKKIPVTLNPRVETSAARVSY
jgi:hypothetical protein